MTNKKSFNILLKCIQPLPKFIHFILHQNLKLSSIIITLISKIPTTNIIYENSKISNN